jgi:hypothetical protein
VSDDVGDTTPSFVQTHRIEVRGTIKVFSDETPDRVLQRLGTTGLWLDDYEVVELSPPVGSPLSEKT